MTSLWELLLVFVKIGFVSIGGGYAIIPSIQEQVVEKNGWITQQTFTDIITISQMTPGPLAVNTSTFVGIQYAGIPGAILATFGCVITGIATSLLLYCFFQKNKNSKYVFAVLNGLKAASIGLIVSAAATILILTFFNGKQAIFINFDFSAVALFLVCLIALRKWKTNPILLMFLTGLVGFFIY